MTQATLPHTSAAALLLLLALTPTTAAAKQHRLPTSGIQINVPKGCTVKRSKDTLNITVPGESPLSLIFMELPAKRLDQALAAVEAQLQKTFKHVTPRGEPAEFTLNGMRGISGDASAKLNGVGVELGLMVLQTPTKRAVLILGMAIKGTTEAQAKTAAKILQNVRPIPGAAKAASKATSKAASEKPGASGGAKPAAATPKTAKRTSTPAKPSSARNKTHKKAPAKTGAKTR